ncbi:MAG: ATPase, central region [Bacteroidetes bacterium]|nr:ATPase, central region [Bacteroidota bacterium]
METTVNTECISAQLSWLSQRIDNLLNKNFTEFLPLPFPGEDTPYGKLIAEHNFGEADRVMLNLAFAATFKPSVLNPLLVHFRDPEKKSRFGGIFREEYGQFYPTVRTAIFLLAADDEEQIDYYLCYFNRKNKLFTSNLLLTHSPEGCQTFSDQQIIFNDQFISTILHGEAPSLDGDAGFPAKRGKRTHTMKDVILDAKTVADLAKLHRFARNMKQLWSLPDSARYRQNFIGIFSGDPGTGKSHTAEAIGNELNLPVYKVNFAQMVSKYIGETEKNLERVFDRFSGQPSILFFDEAESIFSKRIEVKDSHDKHSNNEQSFLLQKIEEYNGIVILATNVQNLSQYFDKAFQRRIRQIVTFSFPEYLERVRLWENALAPPFAYAEGLVDRLAKNYQFSGGSIYNIISEGVIEALDKQTTVLTFELLEQALMDEFKKTGRKYEVCTDEMVMQNPVRRYGQGYEDRRNF